MEARLFLTVETTFTGIPVADDPTEIVLDTSNARFRIVDPSAREVFTVDTVNDPQNGLEAVLRTSATAPAQLQTLYDFDVALAVSGQDVSTYHVEVVLPGAQMVQDLKIEHAQNAREIVAAESATPGLPVATLDNQGRFVETTASESEVPGDLPTDASAEVASNVAGSVENDPVQMAGGSFGVGAEVVTDVDVQLDLFAPLAAAIADSDINPVSVQYRMNVYAGLDRLASNLASSNSSSDRASSAAERAHRIGAELNLMAAQMQADMASTDTTLAMASRQAYDAALGQSDLYFRMWTGQGINSEVYQLVSGQQLQHSVFYETGQVQVSDQLLVGLARPALVTVSTPTPYPSGNSSAALFSTFAPAGTPAADTYVELPSGTVVHGAEPSIVVSNSSASQQDGFLRFDLGAMGITAEQVDSAHLSLHQISNSLQSQTNQIASILAQAVPNTTWIESGQGGLVGTAVDATFTATSSTVYSSSTVAGVNSLDITDAVRQAVRVGNANFKRGQTGDSAQLDFEAFQELYANPAAYLVDYGLSTTLPGNVQTQVKGVSMNLNQDILYRTDADFDGRITSSDLGPFLTLHGEVQGDINFDTVINGLDVAQITAHWLQQGSTIYEQGDATFDGVINGLDLSMLATKWLATGTGQVLSPQLTLRLSLGPTAIGSVTYASANDTNPSHQKPLLTVQQTPDLVIKDFSAAANGALQVSYVIASNSATNSPIPSFNIGVYSSADGSTNQTLLQSFSITNPDDLKPGPHANVVLTAGTAFEGGAGANVFLRAVLNDGNTLGEADNPNSATSNDSMVFQGGVFVTPNTIQVQGRPTTDGSTVGDSVAIATNSVTLNGTVFAGSFAGKTIYVRTHAGNDSLTITEPSGSMLPTMTLLADGGNNSLTVDDTASSASQTISLSSSGLSINGSNINTTGISSLTVSTDGTGDSFTVNAPSASLRSLVLDARGGNDSFSFGALPLGIEVTAMGGAGTNSLSITGGPDDRVIAVTAGGVTMGATTVGFFQIGTLSVTGAAADVTISAYGSMAGTTVSLNSAATAGSSAFLIDKTFAPQSLTVSGSSAIAANSLNLSNSGRTTLAGLSLSNIQSLNLRHNSFTTAPALPGNLSTTLTTLDLRYNRIDLNAPAGATSGNLSALVAANSLQQLDLFGNLTAADGSTNLVDLKGKLLRVDLAAVGLDQAESQAIANLANDATNPLLPIVQALHYLPLEIYDYVVNNYAFQLYNGQVKGDQGTIASRAGNDVDQATLLNSLFTSINITSSLINAPYISTSSPGVTIPLADALQWLGVSNGDALADLFNNSSVSFVIDVANLSIGLSHTWLTTTINGHSLALDPSWKQSTSTTNIQGVLDAYNLPHGTAYHSLGQIVAEYPGSANSFKPTANSFTTSPFYAAPSASGQVAYQWFQDQAAQWLAQNAPGYTMADAGVHTVIQPILTTAAALPTAPINGRAISISSITSLGDQAEYVRFVLKGHDGSNPLKLDVPLPNIAMRDVTVRWGGDQNRTATLYIGETPWLSRTYLSTATQFDFEFGFIAPGADRNSSSVVINQDQNYSRPIGKVIAVGIDAGQITDRLVERQQSLVNADALPILANPGTIGTFSEAKVAHVLSLAMSEYFLLVDQGQATADALFHTIASRGSIAAGVVTADSPVPIGGMTPLTSADVHTDLQIPIVPRGLFVDVPRNVYTATSYEGDLDAETQREYLVSASSSSQESGIFEQLLNTPTISTVRSFQLANQAQIPIGAFGHAITSTADAQNWAGTVASVLGGIGEANGGLTADQIGSINSTLSSQPVGSTVWIYLPEKRTIITDSSNSTLWQGFTYFLDVRIPNGGFTNLWYIDGTTGTSGAGGSPYGQPVPTSQLFNGNPGLAKAVGDPMNVANGAAYEDVEDINIPNIGLPVVFDRHYDSTTDGDPTLGKGWWGSYSDTLQFNGSSPTFDSIVWTNNQGQKFTFLRESANYKTPVGLKAELTKVTSADYPNQAYVDNYKIRDENGVSRIFDTNGRLIAITDLNGAALRVVRDSAHNYRIDKVYDINETPTTMALYFGYSPNTDHLSSIMDATSQFRTWLYSVSQDGYLQSVQDPHLPNSPTPTFSYAYYGVGANSGDGTGGTPVAGHLKQLTLANGSITQYSYYPNGRVFQVTNPDKSVQTIEYNAFARYASFIDERGNRTDHFYNRTGLETRVVHPDGSLETKIWDEKNGTGKLIFSTNAYGVTTQYTYWDDSTFSTRGGRFNEISTKTLGTLPANATQDSTLSIASTSDPDSNGNLLSVPLVTSYFYNDAPGAPQSPSNFRFVKVSAVNSPSAIQNLRTSHTTYDNNGNPIQITRTLNASGGTATVQSVTSLSYLTGYYYAGLLAERSVYVTGSPVAEDTKYSGYGYTGQANLVTHWVSGPLTGGYSTTEHYGYDSRGFLSFYIDAIGVATGDTNHHITTYAYDLLGHQLGAVYPAADATSTAGGTSSVYNPDGSLLYTNDTDGRKTVFAYDAMQRVVQTTVFPTLTSTVPVSIVTSSYDAKGNKISQTDADGNLTRYAYDSSDRLVETIYPDGSFTSAFYNAAGQPVLQIDANGNQTNTFYDRYGHVTKVQQPDPHDGHNSRPVTTYTYDAAGNQLTTTQPGAGTQQSAVTSYSYDGLGRVVQRIDPSPTGGAAAADTPVWTFTYDAGGRVVNKYLFNGSQLNGAHVVMFFATPLQATSNAYDGRGLLLTQTDTNSPADTVWTYSYDANGNRTQVIDPNSKTTNYTYDNLNRLKTLTNPDTSQWTYTYDLVGNTLKKTLTGAQDSLSTPAPTGFLAETAYDYDALNRIITQRQYVTASQYTTATNVYDPAGNLLASAAPLVLGAGVDPMLHVTRYGYDVRNRRIAATDPLGATTKTTYDANGNLATTTDARGAWTAYAYDGLNRIATIVSPNSFVSFFGPEKPLQTNQYDAAGNLVEVYHGSVAVPLQRHSSYLYDNLHRLTQQTDPAAGINQVRRATKYAYDTAGNKVTTTAFGDLAGNTSTLLVTQYVYDQLHHLIKETDPDPDTVLVNGVLTNGPEAARTKYFAYDPAGNLKISQLVSAEPGSPTLSYVGYRYDNMNRQVEVDDYDVSGSSLVIAPPGGNQPTSGVVGFDPIAASTTTAYDGAGNVEFVKQTVGVFRNTYSAYDGLGRVIDQRQLDAAGVTRTQTTSVYDAAGNLLNSTIVNGGSTDPSRSTLYYYDLNNRLTSVLDPLGHVTRTTYDEVGNVTTTTDAAGNTTSYVYDDLHRRTTVTDALGHSTFTLYNEANSVTTVTTPDGLRTTYQYDGLDRVTTETVANSVDSATLSTIYSYDVHGNPAQITDRNNHVRQFTYDAYGRKTQESWPTWSEVFSYTYSPDDQLTYADDKISGVLKSSYSYDFQIGTAKDPLHRVVSQTFQQLSPASNVGSLPAVTTYYAFDSAGDLTNRRIETGASAGFQQGFWYDDLGRATDVAQGGTAGGSPVVSQSTQFIWNFAGEVIGITRAAGSASGPSTAVSYDQAGRTTSISAAGRQYAYAYDPADRITSETDTGAVDGLIDVSKYNYDATSQLTAAAYATSSGSPAGSAASEVFGYDAAGGRSWSATSNGPITYDKWHRVQNDGTYSYQYDNEGNLTRQTIIATGNYVTFNWDLRNRLINVTAHNAASTNLVYVDYKFDALDNRIAKYVTGANFGGQVTTTSYAYDTVMGETNPLLARGADVAAGLITHRYLYGPGLASGAVSQILSDDWSANGQTSNNIRWALSDIRGSVRELVSGASTSGVANNAEVAAFHYDSFGQLTAGSGSPAGTHGPSAPSPAAVDFLFGYAGGVYDGETAAYNSGQALYHMGAREYTPVLGQFLSQDPIHADVVNPYRYAGNDPVNGTDPSGLFTRSVNASLIGSVFGGSGALSGLLAAEEEEAEEEAAAAASLRSASYGRANYGGLTYGGSSGNPALTFSGTTLDYGSRYAALNAPLSPLQLVQQNLATSNSPPSGPAVAASQASSTTWVWPWSSNATWNTVNTLATWTGGDAETLAIGLTKGGENVLTGVRSAALEMPRLAADVTVGTALAGYDRLGAATGLWNVSSIQKTPYSMTGQSVAAQLESGASYLGTATSTFGSGLFSAGTLGIGPSAVGAYKYFDTGDPTEWQTAAGGQFVASSVPLGVKYGSAIASTVRASSELISPGWLPEQPLLNRHYTSPSGLAGIKRDMAINPSRGDIIGVDVEMGPPFGTAKPWGLSSPQRQLGLSKGGAYVEFNRVGTEISTPWVSESSRVTARIPTESPLSLEGLDPRFVTVRWWKPWTWNQ